MYKQPTGFFTKMPTRHAGNKAVFSRNYLANQAVHTWKDEIDPSSLTMYKNQLKMDQRSEFKA